MSEKQEPIKMQSLCDKHQSLLVQQTGYKETDPWRVLMIASQITLFQAASCEDLVHKKIGGDIHRIGELGCLACLKPDVFGEIVEIGKTKNIRAIKELGERYVNHESKKL